MKLESIYYYLLTLTHPKLPVKEALLTFLLSRNRFSLCQDWRVITICSSYFPLLTLDIYRSPHSPYCGGCAIAGCGKGRLRSWRFGLGFGGMQSQTTGRQRLTSPPPPPISLWITGHLSEVFRPREIKVSHLHGIN
jgi:hypothetical protein